MKILQVLRNKLPKDVYYKKWFIISVMLIVFGCLFAFTKPVILKTIIRYLCVAKPGRYVRSKHESKQKFTYSLYLWNVTNPNEIAAGTEKPKMQEIGPYVFSQLKQKVNSIDNKEDDTVSFNYWSIYNFNPKLSAPLTGNEVVTLLNVFMVAAVVKIKLESPHLMNIITESMDIIYKNPSSIFVTMTAMDFISKGIEIDCNHTAYAVKVVCADIRKHKMLQLVNEEAKLYRFRWFDRLNDTLQARYTIDRGSKNIRNIGHVLAINGEPKLKVFKDNDKCNIINGTDKMFFAPFQQKDDVLWVYSDEGCKSLPIRYKYGKRMYFVKTAYKYLNLADPLLDPTCECNRYTGCATPGTVDLFNCWGVFIIGSAPHFLAADSKIRETLEGMNPKEELHETGVYFDLLTSGPIMAHERFQASFLIKRIPEYHIFSSIAEDVYIPVLWYEEKFRIENWDLALIIGSILSKITGVLAGYIFLSIGIIIFITVAGLRFNLYTLDNVPEIIPKVIKVFPMPDEKQHTLKLGLVDSSEEILPGSPTEPADRPDSSFGKHKIAETDYI